MSLYQNGILEDFVMIQMKQYFSYLSHSNNTFTIFGLFAYCWYYVFKIFLPLLNGLIFT